MACFSWKNKKKVQGKGFELLDRFAKGRLCFKENVVIKSKKGDLHSGSSNARIDRYWF
jgi:hypothetical protein